jgi:hypothetical protein
MPQPHSRRPLKTRFNPGRDAFISTAIDKITTGKIWLWASRSGGVTCNCIAELTSTHIRRVHRGRGDGGRRVEAIAVSRWGRSKPASSPATAYFHPTDRSPGRISRRQHSIIRSRLILKVHFLPPAGVPDAPAGNASGSSQRRCVVVLHLQGGHLRIPARAQLGVCPPRNEGSLATTGRRHLTGWSEIDRSAECSCDGHGPVRADGGPNGELIG